MRKIKKGINIRSSIIALAVSATLASCSNELPKNQEEKYKFIETEVNKEAGLFNSESEAASRNEQLVTSALDEALENNDFEYAKRYCILLKPLNYPEADRYEEKIRNAKSTILKESLKKELEDNNFVNARKLCEELNADNPSEADKYKNIIKNAESTYLISQNSEDGNNRIISSINSWPSAKEPIGSETESLHMYDAQAKGHNKQIDEYLDLALKYKNDVLAQKLLSLYVDELIYKSAKKNDHTVNVVSGYSDSHQKDATKRYQEAKKHW